jgi:peptidoglycan/LPS O-acetylase OafA/YrhL
MRNQRLDVLRCVAVLLVILHHGHILDFFTRTGWVGVDLFFVLSGFLISGLLFSEYKKSGSIGFKRFFIRRALKIYPAFYVFQALTAVVELGIHNLSSPTRYLHELLFIQNYAPGVWDHTWSLAIEEHFYVFLPIFLLILLQFSGKRANPFWVIPQAFLAIAVLCAAFRASSVFLATPNFTVPYIASHARMDALFFGVMIGYFHHFRPQTLENLMRPTRNRMIILLVSTAFLSTAYFYPRENSYFMTFGLSFLYLGFGGLLLLSLYVRGILPTAFGKLAGPMGRAFAFVGMYSYSIYLWHGPVGAFFPGLVRRTLHISMGEYRRFAIYFVASLVIGIVMSRLVEYPVLRLRDRIFPKSGAMPVGSKTPTAVVATPSPAESD